MSTRTWLDTDYYGLLGVEPDAGAEEIARAFRASAKDHHPDRTDNSAAREQFTALSAAYGVVGNPERRARYDELRARARVGVRDASAPGAGVGTDPHRPLSVRAFPDSRHGRWASIGGISLVVVGIVAAVLVLWLAASGPGRTTNGSDPAGRTITLGLVSAKLIVVGIVFVVLGNRRRRYP